METLFNPINAIEESLLMAIQEDIKSSKTNIWVNFNPILRPSDPKYGDYQINGILPLAKKLKKNPKLMANELFDIINNSPYFDDSLVTISITGSGFINFKLSNSYLLNWIIKYSNKSIITSEAKKRFKNKRVVIDFPSANTAKQAHIGHLRPMVIGESISRLLEFSGAKLTRDNHIGDWGTNFGTLLMIIKKNKVDISKLGQPDTALAILDSLYKEGFKLENDEIRYRDISRKELVALQNNNFENKKIWESITDISNKSFNEIFKKLNVKIDITLGESFYKDKVNRVYKELVEEGIAEESDGALVVWHDELKKFSRENKKPFPFNIRKKDGASNYATTDLATILYRVHEFKCEEVIYLTDSRQKDHFEQLFLTTKKWFSKKSYYIPKLTHIHWGTILGKDNKPIKTKSGESVKLNALINESIDRAYKIITKKNPKLLENEKQIIASKIGIGALKYADLSCNRSQNYVFNWDKMLKFEGNTAPYLLYVIARINSVFRNANISDLDFKKCSIMESKFEVEIIKKLMGFPQAIELTISDLRPHYLCNYLYELSCSFNTFYNNEKILCENKEDQIRRLIISHNTHQILSIGLDLLGIETVDQM